MEHALTYVKTEMTTSLHLPKEEKHCKNSARYNLPEAQVKQQQSRMLQILRGLLYKNKKPGKILEVMAPMELLMLTETS